MLKTVCLFVILASLATDGARGECTKEWIKLIVTNVCSYSSKRHSTRHPPPISFTAFTREEVDRRFKQMIGEQELFDFEEVMEEYIKEIQREARRRRPRRFVNVRDYTRSGDLFGTPMNWTDFKELSEQNNKGRIMKRHILDMIERCCKYTCTVDDFRGVCH